MCAVGEGVCAEVGGGGWAQRTVPTLSFPAIERSGGQGHGGERVQRKPESPWALIPSPPALPDSHILRGCKGEIGEFLGFYLEEGL